MDFSYSDIDFELSVVNLFLGWGGVSGFFVGGDESLVKGAKVASKECKLSSKGGEPASKVESRK